MNPIRIFVVDDHAIFRCGLAALVAHEPSLAWAGEATTAEEALRCAVTRLPDVLLLDMVMPGCSSLALLERLKRELPHTRVLALSCTVDGANARAALDAGVAGYLLKLTTPQDMLRAIHAAMEGRRVVSPAVIEAIDKADRAARLGAALTERERCLLALMARGLPNQTISERMQIGVPTVKFHVTNILSKLQADNRPAAVLKALRLQLVALEP